MPFQCEVPLCGFSTVRDYVRRGHDFRDECLGRISKEMFWQWIWAYRCKCDKSGK